MSSPTPTGTHSSSAASSSSVHPQYGEGAFPATLRQPPFHPDPHRYAAASSPALLREAEADPYDGFILRPHHSANVPLVTPLRPTTDTSREEWAFSPRCSSAVAASGVEAFAENTPEADLLGPPYIPPQRLPRSPLAEVPRPRRHLRPVVVPMQRTYLVARWPSPPMPTQRGRKRSGDSISADRTQRSHAVAAPLPPNMAPSAPGPSPKRRRVHYVDRQCFVSGDKRHETSTMLASRDGRGNEAAEEPSRRALEEQGLRAAGDCGRRARRAYVIESPSSSVEHGASPAAADSVPQTVAEQGELAGGDSGRATRRAYVIASPSSSVRHGGTPAAAASVPHEQSGQVVDGPSAQAVGDTSGARGAYLIESPLFSEYRDDSYGYVADDAGAHDRAAAQGRSPSLHYDAQAAHSPRRYAGQEDDSDGNRVRKEVAGAATARGEESRRADGVRAVVGVGANWGGDEGTDSTSSYSSSSSGGGDFDREVERAAAPHERASEVFVAYVRRASGAEAAEFGLGRGAYVGRWHDMGNGVDRRR
ncbi:hypothetical protein FGB62_60g019 [Gracilaria domingensis]|nr:hypothetical protein FGB62_60g019 [Gracilaria domingensis]